MSIRIRGFMAHDICAINQLIAKLAITQGDEADPSAEHLLYDLTDTTIPLSAVVAVTQQDGVVGFAIFHPSFYSSNSNTWQVFVLDLFVDDAFRSKGIGRRLLRKVAKYCEGRNRARGRGFDFFYLEVLKTNLQALHFYERLGGCRNSDNRRHNKEFWQMRFAVADMLK